MAYRITKFFLSLILLICVVWAALIFAGPKLISYAVGHYFGDTVKISGLKVSPKLRIYAARVNYTGADLGNFGPLHGYSRAVSVYIDNFTGLNPHFNISLGPSEFIGLFDFSELNTKVFFTQDDETDNLKISTKVKNYESKDFKFEALEAVALMDPTFKKINTVQYDFQNIKAISPLKISAQNVVGKLVDVVFDNEKVESFQIAYNDIMTLSLASSIYGEQLSATGISSHGSFNEQKLKYSLNFDEILMGNKGSMAKEVTVDAIYSIPEQMKRGQFDFSAGALYLNEFETIEKGASISNLSGSAKFQDSHLKSIQIDGRLNPITVKNKGSFLVEIPEGHLKANSYFLTEQGNNNAQLDISLDSNESKNLLLKADLNASFGEGNIIACVFVTCRLSELIVDYSVDVARSKMNGSLYCKTTDCWAQEFSHRVETQNTAEFFNAVSITKLINPMLLAYSYSEILRGEKNGQGHIKDF